MGVFESNRTFPTNLPSLEPVAEAVMNHFQQQEFEVLKEPTITGGWDISVSKGGVFKAVCGMKTALKIEIEPVGNTLTAKAHVGIFGMQAVPTAISLLIFWPVLITQIWGIVQQSKLDEEALECIEYYLQTHSSEAAAHSESAFNTGSTRNFCTQCGHKTTPEARFCSHCGSAVV